jgi:hypothetical protein
MMIARRFLVVQALLLWQGGFLFYASIVVPKGTELLGAAGQGAITARVTYGLNGIGFVALGLLALELRYTRDPKPGRTRHRWWFWSALLVCQGLLCYLHILLEALMDDSRRRVLVRTTFYPLHQMYLWTSIVQSAACLILSWRTLSAWRAEDRG